MTADELISRLDGVKQTGPDKWLARCPAHDDRSPSLSVRETDDGTILLHCFAGCTALDIVESVGLEFRDLFPAGNVRRVDRRDRGVPRLSATERLELVDHEVRVAVLILSDMLESKTVTEAEWQRVAQCSERISRARYV